MSTLPDPFDTFRRERETPAFPKSRTDGHAVYATRIAELLDGLDERADMPDELVLPNAPPRTQIQGIVSRLYCELEGGSEARGRIATLLAHFARAAERLLGRGRRRVPLPAQEFEMSHGDLFEFMLAPDAEMLRRRS